MQETEKGMLIARKSRWKDFTRGIRQHVAIVGSTLSLWKTSIQTIEARHGEHPHNVIKCMQSLALECHASSKHIHGKQCTTRQCNKWGACGLQDLMSR